MALPPFRDSVDLLATKLTSTEFKALTVLIALMVSTVSAVLALASKDSADSPAIKPTSLVLTASAASQALTVSRDSMDLTVLAALMDSVAPTMLASTESMALVVPLVLLPVVPLVVLLV